MDDDASYFHEHAMDAPDNDLVSLRTMQKPDWLTFTAAGSDAAVTILPLIRPLRLAQPQNDKAGYGVALNRAALFLCPIVTIKISLGHVISVQ